MAFMRNLPHSRIWQKCLLTMYDEQKATAFLSRAQHYYEGFYAQHSEEKNRANRTALKIRILPGLSIYKALLEENSDQQKVLAEVDTLLRAAFFTKRMQGIRLLNTLRDPFPIVKPVLKSISRAEYLPGSQEIVEDNADCFALNVYRCFIFDTLVQHGAGELTSLFCNTDDWLSELLPRISWERTMTLGRGGDRCDFRWSRIKVSTNENSQ